MDNEFIQISMSAEQLRQVGQILQTIHTAVSGAQMGCQPLGRFVTIDERCRQRWPLATPKQRERIRDVCLARYREQVGRSPYKLTGHINAPFMIEDVFLTILDRAIDVVRNEVEAREKMPLFQRRLC